MTGLEPSAPDDGGRVMGLLMQAGHQEKVSAGGAKIGYDPLSEKIVFGRFFSPSGASCAQTHSARQLCPRHVVTEQTETGDALEPTNLSRTNVPVK